MYWYTISVAVPMLPGLQGSEIHISFITEIELQSKASLTEVDLKQIRAALINYRISDVNPAIKQLAAQLRRRHGLSWPMP